MRSMEFAKILLVDDDQMTRSLLTTMLKGSGYRVTAAGSARDALVAVDTATPDLVLLDISMPRAGGYSLARQLRERFGSHVAIVPVTGVPPADPKRPADVRFDGWVEKPFELGSLLSTIKACLAARGCRPAY